MADKTIITKFQAEGLEQFTAQVETTSDKMELFDKAQKIVSQTTVNLTKKQLELKEQINSTGGILQKLNETGKTSGTLYADLQSKLKKLVTEYQNENKELEKKSTELKKVTLDSNNYAKILQQVAQGETSAREAAKLLKQEFIKLKLEGKGNSQQFQELKKVAGELNGAISDTSAEIRQAGSDTNGLDHVLRVSNSVVAGFSLVQGAAGLLGGENENLQKTLLKVNSAMLILSAAQQIQEELTKEDSKLKIIQIGVQKLYSVAVGESTGALLLFRQAMFGLGIGVVIAGLYLLVTNWQKIKDAVTGTTDAMRENIRIAKLNTDTRRDAADSIKGEVANIYELVAVAKNENLTRADRQRAIDELQKKYPDYLKNINLENIGSEKTAELITKQIELLTAREQIKKLVEKKAEIENKLIDKKAIEEDLDFVDKLKNEIVNGGTIYGLNLFGKYNSSKDKSIQNVKDGLVQSSKEIDILITDLINGISKSNKSVFDVTKNGVQSNVQEQNKVVLNELEKLKKDLEKKKKELEDKVSFNVVKGLDSESGGVIKIRTEITGLENQIRAIENLISGTKLKPLELQVQTSENFEVDLKRQIDKATAKFTDAFNLALQSGENIQDNPALQAQVNKIKELQAELDRLKKIYDSYFDEIKQEETAGTVPILELAEQRIKLSKREYEQKKKDAENFRKENLISEQEYTEEIKKLSEQRIATINENAQKAQTIYSEIFKVVSQGTDLAKQIIGNNAQRELQIIEEKKNKGLISERQFQKESAKIKNEEAKKQRKAEIAMATAKIPLIALEAFLSGAKFGPIVAGIMAGIATAFAIAQVAVLANAPLPKFRHGGSVQDVFKGSGYVRGKAHEQGGVNANLEGNEYVFRREAVTKYGIANLDKLNKGLLKPDIFSFPLISTRFLNENPKEIRLTADFDKLQSKLGEKLEYIYQGIQKGNNERFSLNKQIINKLDKKDGKRT